ncbi:MAG: hypothetical protein HYV17_03310 [Xanthomonadales bacterium]|nr:hypothetical protein [Xanthomonadales bacterium]
MRAVLGGMVSLLALAGAVQAVEVADYRFQGSYASSVGAAPVLTALAGTQSFVTDTVAGSPTTVLSFAEGAGLVLTPTTGLIASNTYSVAMLVRFDDVSGYRKILDFRNGTDDDGLYNYSGELYLYPDFEGTPTPITAGAYHWVVMTRDGAGNIVGYVDAAQQITGSDTNGIGIIDAANTLRFFADDTTTTGEESAGAVSRIRIFDHVLSQPEVAALGGPAIAVPVPGTSRPGLAALLALVLASALLALARRR